jgi:hypothetical protein
MIFDHWIWLNFFKVILQIIFSRVTIMLLNKLKDLLESCFDHYYSWYDSFFYFYFYFFGFYILIRISCLFLLLFQTSNCFLYIKGRICVMKSVAGWWSMQSSWFHMFWLQFPCSKHKGITRFYKTHSCTVT